PAERGGADPWSRQRAVVVAPHAVGAPDLHAEPGRRGLEDRQVRGHARGRVDVEADPGLAELAAVVGRGLPDRGRVSVDRLTNRARILRARAERVVLDRRDLLQ